MSAQHTPGPWVVDPESPTWVEDGNGCCLAKTGYGDDEGDRANARLIAAAPDMLAALRALHDNIAEYAKINNLGGFDNHDMRQARAAIAKAEGR